MNVQHVGQMLVGAIGIYVVMAACSAAGTGSDTPTGAPPGSPPPSGTAPPGATSTTGLTNPVPTASAAPGTTPTAYVTNCDKTYSFGGFTWRYAQRDFVGATKADLASVVVLIDYPDTVNHPPGFNTVVTAPYVKDGSVAYVCGLDSSSSTPSSITFVKP